MFYLTIYTAFVGQPNKEILVSNCRSVDNDMSPSFEVSLDPATSSVVFYGQTKLGQAELRVQYDVSIIIVTHHSKKDLIGIPR